MQNTQYDMSDSPTTEAVVCSTSLLAPGSITVPSSKRLCPIRLAKSSGVSPRSLATNSLGLLRKLTNSKCFPYTWCFALEDGGSDFFVDTVDVQGFSWRGPLVYLDTSSRNQLARVGKLIAYPRPKTSMFPFLLYTFESFFH